MINILLAEDHTVVRNGIKTLIDREPDIKVIAEAVNGAEALSKLKEGLEPDIILADINMPEMNGIELLSHLRDFPKVKAIMLSMLDHERYVFEAFKAGAMGYILKNVSASELIFGLRHVYEVNDRYVCNELSLRFMDKLMTTPLTTSFDDQDIELSNREVEILHFISEGFTNQEIADKLFTSKRTVEGHRQSILDKTGMRNTAALVRYAFLKGIVN
jgi:DNA-binding NarL/FixJ family response regulator